MTQSATFIAQTFRSLTLMRRLLSRPRLHHWALFLTVTGWSLMWAKALGLVSFVLVSGTVLVFVLGLGLIPLSRTRARPLSKRRQRTTRAGGRAWT
jgi:hypothetical protein